MRNMIPKASASCAILSLAISLTGCQGRTAENMEPSGDTVEVTVLEHGDTTSTCPDTIPMPE